MAARLDESKSDRRGPVIVLFAALAAGVLLRLVGIHWGLPNSEHYFSYHPDEIFLLLPSFGFAEGDWNPHFFNYGTLYIYLIGLPAVLLQLVPSPDRFPLGLHTLYLEGRLITALLGTATVGLLYLAGSRESRWLAAMSAALLAVCPLHVVTSHYATVDVPATFFLTLAFVLALRGAADQRGKTSFALGLAVGLAAATKYNVGLFIVPALLAPALGPARRFPPSWWLGLPAGAALGFLIGCPFAVTGEFLEGVAYELRHARIGGTLAFVDAGSGWAYHLLRGLPVGLGFPLLISVIVGIAAMMRRSGPAARLSLLWVVGYLLMIGFGRERFIRYLVPVAPFLCVIAAAGFRTLADTAREARGSVAVLAALLVLVTGAHTAGQVARFLPPDPRDSAWSAVRPQLDAPESEARVGLPSFPWFFHPPVSPFNAGAYSRPSFAEWNERVGGRVVLTGWSTEALADLRPRFFFLSDLEVRDRLRLSDPAATEFVAELDRLYGERTEFLPPRAPFAWLAPGGESAPPDWLYQSPHITLYAEPRP